MKMSEPSSLFECYKAIILTYLESYFGEPSVPSIDTAKYAFASFRLSPSSTFK